MYTVTSYFYFLFLLFEVVFAIYLVTPFMMWLLSLFLQKKDVINHPIQNIQVEGNVDFAAIITVHQDTRFILPFVDSFLKQTYKNFIVYIIADDCDISSFSFNDNRIKLIRPAHPIHSKVKSIRYAIDHFERKHEVLVIFDSDSLVHPRYFEKLSAYFLAGFSAVQTIAISKNTDSVYAKVETLGWVFTTFMERESRMMLGLSSTVSGNGIAIKTDVYNEIVYVDSLGGFDKRLQSFLAKRLDQVAFANDAIVYEEKVNDGQSFETQRTRWIYSYFKYFNDFLSVLFLGLKKMNFNKIYFGFNAMRPPLFLTVGISFLLMVMSLFIEPMHAVFLGTLIVLFLFSFVLIALTKGYQKGMGSAIVYLPKVVFLQVKALLKIGKASKSFLKTEHNEIIYIDDLLKK